MNKTERAKLQHILVEYIENPRKMGGCILDIEELFRKVHERWNGFARNKVGGGNLAEEIIVEIADRNNISMDTILGPSRSARVLAVRREIIITMNDAGFSQSEIARSINRHPSTVLHTLQKVRDGK
jgi:hypothetical protein